MANIPLCAAKFWREDDAMLNISVELLGTYFGGVMQFEFKTTK